MTVAFLVVLTAQEHRNVHHAQYLWVRIRSFEVMEGRRVEVNNL